MNKCCEIFFLVVGVWVVFLWLLTLPDASSGEEIPYVLLAAAVCFSVAFACYILRWCCGGKDEDEQLRNEETRKSFERSSEVYWKLREGDIAINLEKPNAMDSPYPWSRGLALEHV